MAAAVTSGTMSFERSHSTVSGHLVANGSAGQVLTIKTTCLDDFVLREGHDRPDFINMDIDGAKAFAELSFEGAGFDGTSTLRNEVNVSDSSY
jgi:hypothetical protein